MGGTEQSAAEQSAPRPATATPVAKPVVRRSTREICDTLVESAQSNALPIPFFIHLLFQESGFQPDVVSRAGAQGIAQFMPETAATVGLDNPFDPLQAIAASARLLRNLVKQFGNLGLAAAAYNAGPRRIQDWLARKGKLPEETQHYVKTITGRPAETWKAARAASPVHNCRAMLPARKRLAWSPRTHRAIPRSQAGAPPLSAHLRSWRSRRCLPPTSQGGKRMPRGVSSWRRPAGRNIRKQCGYHCAKRVP
jgi:hypothetical protein